jgi:hypothetical protein
MAQQARPKVAGHTERARAQPATFSTEVSSTPLGSVSSRPMTTPKWRSVYRDSPRGHDIYAQSRVTWPPKQCR